jgi:hypothetical protein
MLDSKERLLSLPKSTLREYGFVRTSPMPPAEGRLTLEEVDDLVGYLVTLKGLNP